MALDSLNGSPRRSDILRQLAAFFGLTFAISWGLGALLLFARPQLEAVVGPIGPTSDSWLFYLAVYSPSFSAVMVTLATGGWTGLRALAARFIRPTRPIWILVAVFAWPAALAVWELAMRGVGAGGAIDLHALAVGAPVMALTTMVLIRDAGGVGEELGWRGFALPRLLTLWPPLPAAVVLGLIWGLWHLPAFFVSDLTQSQFGFGWFVLETTATSVFVTWIYLNANGNLLVAGTIPHLIFNLMPAAHVFPGGGEIQNRVQAIVMSLIALTVLGLYGPSLTGWRRRDAVPEPRGGW